MTKKVYYQIERKKARLVKIDNEEQERAVKILNRDFERMYKADLAYHARCSSIEEMEELTGLGIKDIQADTEEKIIMEETRQEQKELVKKALTYLTDRQRTFIRLIFFEEKTQEEVAHQFGISKQAVRNAMARIYASLKKIIKNF